MSHFVVAVLVDQETEDYETAVGELLEPYSEHMDVDEYGKACHCIGRVASIEARREAEEKAGTINLLRADFWSKVEELYPPEIKLLKQRRENGNALSKEENERVWAERSRISEELDWKEHIKEYRDTMDSALERHPDKDKPDPMCGRYDGPREDWWPDDAQEGDRMGDDDGCGGTGTYRTTYNPDSKWGWWVIGGRWTGFYSSYVAADDPDNYKTCNWCSGTGTRTDGVCPGEGNCNGCSGTGSSRNFSNKPMPQHDIMPVAKLLPQVEEKGPPFALLTPDGWCERGRSMGWFATISGEDEDWDTRAGGILADYTDCVAVLVDCHI